MLLASAWIITGIRHLIVTKHNVNMINMTNIRKRRGGVANGEQRHTLGAEV